MGSSASELLPGIAKGTLKSKVKVYRELLVQHYLDPDAIQAMQARLAIEPSGAFNKVKAMDQSSGPRLDWPSIYAQRIFTCKNEDERRSAINDRDDYGPDTDELLTKLALEDETPKMRPWAFTNLCRRNKGSAATHFVDLAKQMLEAHPVESRTPHGGVIAPLWDLGPSPELFALIAAELEEKPLLAPAELASVMVKNHSELAPLFDRLHALCREEFGPGQEEWHQVNTSRNGQGAALWQMLKTIFEKWSPLSTDIEFARYAVDLATGPMKRLSRGSDPERGPEIEYYLQRLANYLSTHEDTEVANELRMQVFDDEQFPEKSRAIFLGGYVEAKIKSGDSPEEVRASVAHLLTDDHPEMLKRSADWFTPKPVPDEHAVAKARQARQDRLDAKARQAIPWQFVSFIAPFSTDDDQRSFLNPASGSLPEMTEDSDAAELFTTLCAKADRDDDRYYIITQDARDRGAVSGCVDRSRESLGLSPLDDVYSSDEDYGAPVKRQYQIYAEYLRAKGYRLVFLYPGWDDLSAAVISAEQQAGFEAFMVETMPGLDYQIA